MPRANDAQAVLAAAARNAVQRVQSGTSASGPGLGGAEPDVFCRPGAWGGSEAVAQQDLIDGRWNPPGIKPAT